MCLTNHLKLLFIDISMNNRVSKIESLLFPFRVIFISLTDALQKTL